MKKLPANPEEKIGSPQIISREIVIDGLKALVRLQKPLEEPLTDDAGNIIQVDEDISHPFGCALIIEVWSDATKSIITLGMKRSEAQTEEEFAFGARYLMNNASDRDLVHIFKTKGITSNLKYQVSRSDAHLQLPVAPPLPPKKAKEK